MDWTSDEGTGLVMKGLDNEGTGLVIKGLDY